MQSDPEKMMGARVFGSGDGRPTRVIDGFGETALLAVRHCEIVARVAVCGFAPQHLRIEFCRFRQRPLSMKPKRFLQKRANR
jgi:hypothetical protein